MHHPQLRPPGLKVSASGLSTVLAGLAALLLAAPCIARAARPNIVILLADDMGFGDVAVQNPDSKIPTPHLDRLAREGTRFTDAHSSSGVCTPSRYALLTGRYHWRRRHEIVRSFEGSVFEPGELTLPRMLQQQGYRTACVGKWHLGWNWDAIKQPGAGAEPKTGYPPEAFDWSRPIPGGPRDQGFDYYFGDDVPNFPPYAWFENDRVIAAPTMPLATPPDVAEGKWECRPGPMVAGWDFHAVMPTLTRKAVEWIGARRGESQPFFLYVPFTSPHAPIIPTRDFAGKSKAGGYGDYVAQTDDTVGQILRALDTAGLRENTIVIFSADNGAERYAYERVRAFQHRSSGPLRGLKRDLWEGGHRVPFIVRWPGVVAVNKASDALISQIDLMATLAAATGASLPAGKAEDSHDLLAVWKHGAPSPRRALVHNTTAQGYAVRQGDWVLIAAKSGGISAVPGWFDQENGYAANPHAGELYDLRRDLGQRHNRYAERPENVAELTALLARIRAKGEVR